MCIPYDTIVDMKVKQGFFSYLLTAILGGAAVFALGIIAIDKNWIVLKNSEQQVRVGIPAKGNLGLGIDAAKHLSSSEWDSGIQRFKVVVAGKYDEAFKDPISHDNFYEYCNSHGYDKTFTPERLTAIYLAYAMRKTKTTL